MKKLTLTKVFLVSVSLVLFNWNFSLASPTKEEAAEVNKFVDLRNAKYFELGITFGPPAWLNLLVGYWWGQIGYRILGFHWGKYYPLSDDELSAVEFSVNWKVEDKANVLHSFGLLGGVQYWNASTKPLMFRYAGVAYSLNWRGIFLSFGPVIAKDQDNQIEVGTILQIGYVYRFLPNKSKW